MPRCWLGILVPSTTWRFLATRSTSPKARRLRYILFHYLTGLETQPANSLLQVQRVASVVADRDGVFWIQHDSAVDGTVRRCPHEGCTGQPEILATAPRPVSIVSDDVSVYWSSKPGSVFRLAK